jgi:hypothetical protein
VEDLEGCELISRLTARHASTIMFNSAASYSNRLLDISKRESNVSGGDS